MKTESVKIGLNGASLTMYLWDDSKELKIGKRPAVLVFPGGGYMMCSDREAEPIALSYMAEGYNVFVLRYTVNKGFELPFSEAQEALDLIRQNADEWRVASDKIAVCGFSAGGHLAVAVGAMAKNKPNAMILGYPAVLKETWDFIYKGIPGLVDKIDKNTAPAFVFSTCSDTLVTVQNTTALLDALGKNGVPFEAHIFQEGQHGASLGKTHTSSGQKTLVLDTVSQWFKMSADWLKLRLGEIETNINL